MDKFHEQDEHMKKIKNKEGFTLLEVIFAVSILTVGILSVAAMQMTSIRGNAFAWGTTEASAVAMSQMEKLKELGPTNSGYSSATGDLANTPITTTTSGLHEYAQGNYALAWSVVENTPATTNMIAGTKTVILTVTWRDHGISRRVVLSSIIGKVV